MATGGSTCQPCDKFHSSAFPSRSLFSLDSLPGPVVFKNSSGILSGILLRILRRLLGFRNDWKGIPSIRLRNLVAEPDTLGSATNQYAILGYTT